MWALCRWSSTSGAAGFEVVEAFESGEESWGRALAQRRAAPELVLRELSLREGQTFVALSDLDDDDPDSATPPEAQQPPRLGEVEDVLRELTFWGGSATAREVAEMLGVREIVAVKAISALRKWGTVGVIRGYQILHRRERQA